MTREQAIDRMYDLIHTCEVGVKKYGSYNDLFSKDKEAIEIVLNMLKEKDKEIEKKDKIIDEMALSFNTELSMCEDCKKCFESKDIYKCCKDCIKQYFESRGLDYES